MSDSEIVIVGAGHAGVQAAASLRDAAATCSRIRSEEEGAFTRQPYPKPHPT